MSKAHKHSKLISEWASNPSGYVIWMAYGVGVDFTWVEAPTPCGWNESVQYKLVPLVKKEKRWIAYSTNQKRLGCLTFNSEIEARNHYIHEVDGPQFIEIEVEA
jgi:hypothetical protein